MNQKNCLTLWEQAEFAASRSGTDPKVAFATELISQACAAMCGNCEKVGAPRKWPSGEYMHAFADYKSGWTPERTGGQGQFFAKCLASAIWKRFE